MLFFQLILAILLFTSFTHTILDDDILYDIKWQPEMPSSIDLANNFIFTSKRKETYSCVLPTPQTTDTTFAETILVAEFEPFLDNLHAQSKSTCTYRLDPYWTYELCHGTHIRQYHESKVAGQRTILQEYFLGYYHADHQHTLVNEYNQRLVWIYYKTINNQDVPMLAVRYKQGTNCDINEGKPRETIILYACHEKGNNGILSFEEVSSCVYVVTIGSPELCKIPVFTSMEHNPNTINCYPHENALQQPRNLKILEQEQQLLAKSGRGAQFTLTSPDGTTFIISYVYANEDEVKDLPIPTSTELTNTVTPFTPSEDKKPPPADIDHVFLKKFLSGEVCLTSGSGWWRFEICYGKHALQFHDEGEKRTSILLGTWNRDKHIQWINTRSEVKVKQEYVSLFYTDGDACELSNIPRVVEVKLKCARKGDQSDALSMYLVEPQTCSYILGVETPLFCDLINYTDENGIPDQEKLFKPVEEQ